jgi:hypothetical protein
MFQVVPPIHLHLPVMLIVQLLLPPAPLPAPLGALAQFLAEEELNLEPAPEQIAQLTPNPKLATFKLVASPVAPVL